MARIGRRGIGAVAACVLAGAFAAGAALAEGAVNGSTGPEAPGSTVSAGPAFDRAFGAQGPAGEARVGAAGRVVERFAPPVAAPIEAGENVKPFPLSRGALIRPCDTPGSGCRNPSPVQPGVVVPPIVPGTRPPGGTPGNS